MPERIQLSRRSGWRMPRNTVKVDRSTPFGNPYKVTPELLAMVNSDRAKAIEACVDSFKDWLAGSDAGRKLTLRIRAELRGKNIACWCPIGSKCHGDLILEIENRK